MEEVCVGHRWLVTNPRYHQEVNEGLYQLMETTDHTCSKCGETKINVTHVPYERDGWGDDSKRTDPFASQ